MSESKLVSILQLLSRQERSQTELCTALGLSKSHLSSLVKSLIAQNLLVRKPRTVHHDYNEPHAAMGRPRETLAVNPECCHTALLQYDEQGCELAVLRFGSTRPLLSRSLKGIKSSEELVSKAALELKSMLKALKLEQDSIKVFAVCADAPLEQGYEGKILQDDILQESGFALGTLLQERLKIPSYVCSRAYTHVKGLIEKHDLKQALVLICGEGSVSPCIVINSQIIWGQRCTLPQCTHLDFPHGLKKSLGSFGPHTDEALEFLVRALSPIFNTADVVISGRTLEGHQDAIEQVQQRLSAGGRPLGQEIKLSYLPLSLEERYLQLCYVSFDEASILLSPQIQKFFHEDEPQLHQFQPALEGYYD